MHRIPFSRLGILLLGSSVFGYTPSPRWGQATAIVDDFLYVHGGMSDPYNEYSYTAAPTTNNVLFLSLSQSFSVSEPPWELVSGSDNSSTSQGPNVAWHTLSAMNTSSILAFGGMSDANSLPPVQTQPDSAWLLDIFNRPSPSWSQQPSSWASEPIRRIRHSTISSPSGRVYIFGGESADGSRSAVSEHFVFDPQGPLFSQLPSENGPPAITGQCSVILPSGTAIVLGGYDGSTDALVPFSTVWTLDTTSSSPSWSTVSGASDTLPTPRRAFACTLFGARNKILIHGGSDATFQQTYSDGWVLDTTQNPWTWSQVEALTNIGARRDHFAVAYGSQVIFGFGYGSSGPATTDLHVYESGESPSGSDGDGDESGGGGDGDGSGGAGGGGSSGGGSGGFGSGGTMAPTFTPSPTSGGHGPGASTSRTIPLATPTGPRGPDSGSQSGGGVQPTSTSDPGNNNNNPNDPGSGSNRRTTAIAVGVALGVLALILLVVFIVHRRRRDMRKLGVEGRFLALPGDDDQDAPGGSPQHAVPLAGGAAYYGTERRSSPANVLRNLGLASPLALLTRKSSPSRTPERRDMLADEDSREFGQWNDWRKREAFGGSAWSLMSILSGGRKTREASTSSLPIGSAWREKADPFSDGAALMRDVETGFVGAAARPTGRRDISYGSTLSSTSYIDPFADPLPEELHQHIYHDLPREDVENQRFGAVAGPSSRHPTGLQVQTMLPITTEPHVLSPVTEGSRNTLSETSQSVSSHSHEHVLSPFDSSSAITSRTSYDPNKSPRPSSLVDQPTQPMRRSDSWWARFSRTSFLDRRASDSGRPRRQMVDIKDPNPPPRLVAIEESQNSGSPENDKDSPGSKRANSIRRGQAALVRAGSRVMSAAQHGKSASSLRTANSEALERMGGMDVAQRERTGSSHTRGSTNTDLSLEADESGRWLPESERVPQVMSPVDMPVGSSFQAAMGQDSMPPLAAPKPVAPAAVPLPPSTKSATPPSATSSATSVASSGSQRPSSVQERVKAYERRLSQDQPERPRRKSRVDYGLVPRPSLFVANPDHQQHAAGSGST